MQKYDPVIWATVNDADIAQRLEANGWTPLFQKNEEGYVRVVGAHKDFGSSSLSLRRAA